MTTIVTVIVFRCDSLVVATVTVALLGGRASWNASYGHFRCLFTGQQLVRQANSPTVAFAQPCLPLRLLPLHVLRK